MNAFECQRCGACCKWAGYVRLLDGEAEKIADFLGLELHFFTGKYTVVTVDRRHLSLIEKTDGSCIFLEDNPPACAINQVKPEQCRNFPQRWNFPGWQNECKGIKEPV